MAMSEDHVAHFEEALAHLEDAQAALERCEGACETEEASILAESFRWRIERAMEAGGHQCEYVAEWEGDDE